VLLSLPDARREYDREVSRISDRLATLPAARLAAPADNGVPRCELVRAAAQAQADAAAELEGRLDGQPPELRALPAVADAALADVLTVVSFDLLRAVDRAVRDPADFGAAEDALRAGLARLQELRRAL
jgi:hypothetical protein